MPIYKVGLCFVIKTPVQSDCRAWASIVWLWSQQAGAHCQSRVKALLGKYCCARFYNAGRD